MAHAHLLYDNLVNDIAPYDINIISTKFFQTTRSLGYKYYIDKVFSNYMLTIIYMYKYKYIIYVMALAKPIS